MRGWAPDVFDINGITQGLEFLFVPLSVTVLATLKPKDRTAGAGIFNLARDIGSSMGTSVVTALLVSNTQTSHAEIGSYVIATNRMLVAPTKRLR